MKVFHKNNGISFWWHTIDSIYPILRLLHILFYPTIHVTSLLLMDIWVAPIFHYYKQCWSKYSCAYIFSHLCDFLFRVINQILISEKLQGFWNDTPWLLVPRVLPFQDAREGQKKNLKQSASWQRGDNLLCRLRSLIGACPACNTVHLFLE